MTVFRIDPDIRKARTLSSDFYTEAEYFELAKEKIFARTWQFVGTEREVDNLKPVDILPGILDEPILLARQNGRIDCLSNVCTHRGKILVEQPCEAKLIRCGYHGRRFSLDGKFLSMPEFDGVKDFPSAADDLPKIPFAAWNGFLFASVDPIAPFEVFVREVNPTLRLGDSEELRLTGSKDYEVDAHWALYCENYLEGFHIPFVHKSLNEIVDYGSYSTETFRYSSLQTALSEPPAAAGGLTQTSPTLNFLSGDVAARYLFIFPNLMFNFYPWGVSVNIVKPVTPQKTVVSFLTYVADESKLGKGAGADLDRVELEDEAVVESVQRGIRSRFYEHGRYSPTREQGTHHFHRLIAEFMS